METLVLHTTRGTLKSVLQGAPETVACSQSADAADRSSCQRTDAGDHSDVGRGFLGQVTQTVNPLR